MHISHSSSRVHQGGATLIEALIAILIMAIGALGLAAMQSVSLKNNSSAMQRTQATVISYSIFDSMRANPDAARTGAYNQTMTCDVPDGDGSLANSDLAFWMNQLQDNIHPEACGEITCNDSLCTASVRWNDERGTGGDSEQTLSTTSRI